MHHRPWRPWRAAGPGLADVDGDVSWHARDHPRWPLVREWRRDGSSPPWGPNYAPDAHTVRNDYGARFVDSGLVTPPRASVPPSAARAAARRLADLGYTAPALATNRAVDHVLVQGQAWTPDLPGGTATTSEVEAAILRALQDS